MADRAQLDRTIQALARNQMEGILVENPSQLRETILRLVPKGSLVSCIECNRVSIVFCPCRNCGKAEGHGGTEQCCQKFFELSHDLNSPSSLSFFFFRTITPDPSRTSPLTRAMVLKRSVWLSSPVFTLRVR